MYRLINRRLLSICLGRPVGVEDSDCDCEIPLDMDDDELQIYSKQPPNLRNKPSNPSRLAGFVSFSRLCNIAGKISRASNALQTSRNGKKPTHAKQREHHQLVLSLDSELSEWFTTVPDNVKFSANGTMDSDSPHLTMCVILYIVHAACVINLHRYESNSVHPKKSI